MVRSLPRLLPVILIFLYILPSLPAGAQTINTDSLRAAQKARTDSLKAIQKARMDSLAAIRQYRSSSRYKDSLAAERQKRLDSMKAARQHITDSLKAYRQHINDSLLQARQHYNDSIRAHLDSVRSEQQKQLELLKARRKKTSDSLAAIREYRQSKTYKDSLAAIRQHRTDSLVAARKKVTDSLRAIQQARTDSMKAARQRFTDSLHVALDSIKAVRQHNLDSLAALRQVRMDSLAKMREQRKALSEKRQKEREKKKELALEIKIKKKQDAYTNEKMRKKKWTVPRQIVQNTFTRYNYYYNANLKMEEAIQNMLRSKQDNYDSLISLFPFNPDVDSAKLASDMDTIISKASVGIQIHDPRSKWQDDLYLLVGESYFYKGDYENASAAFKQIIAQAEADKKEKARKKNGKSSDKNKPASYSEPEKTGLAADLAHVPAKNDAMLWLARTFTQSNKQGQAQTLLDMLHNDAQFPKRLEGRLALEQAFIDLGRDDYKNAVNALSTAGKDEDLPRWQRQRVNFLAGQLLQQSRQYQAANRYFQETIDLHPALEMTFYAQKNIAFNNLQDSTNTQNTDNTKTLLAQMASDDKYRAFYDQIYYGMAKADLKENDIDAAVDHFKKSVRYSQNNKKQKGYTFAALGDVYYRQQQYLTAKAFYDSASMFLTAAQEPEYSLSRQRGQALSQIAAPAGIVQEQDSLIRLAALPEKEQRAIVRKYIRELEKQRADSALLAQNAPAQNISVNLFDNGGNQSWYFANPSLMQQGENTFKQKWGNRTLADNWRRSTKFSSSDNDETDNEADATGNNLPDEDSLLAAIPHGPEQLKAANDKLREALFLLGKGYYTYLEDYPNATRTFDTLDKRFPENNHQAEVLYTRYLMAMRQNDAGQAQAYNRMLQSRFPETEWARLLRQAGLSESTHPAAADTGAVKAEERLSSYYDATYKLLTDHAYADVISRSDQAGKLYPVLGDYAKKFTLMKAVAVAGTGNYPEADSMLRKFISTNTNDSLIPWASAVLHYVQQQYNAPGGTDMQTQPSAPVKDSARIALETAPYTFRPGTMHFVILVAPADMRIFALKSGLLDFNAMRGGKENVTITMTTLDAENNLIVCRSFPDAAAASKFMNDIKKNNKLFREYPKNDYSLVLISEENYNKLLARKNFDDYKKFYDKQYR